MPSKFKLPLIEKLSVRNYALYPGTDGSGIDLDFPSGVKVLAGINGVGKTTMLNLIIRMILGPIERKRSDKELSRSSARLLVEERKAFSFFKDRVPKLDDTSTATLEFSLGRHQIKVTRLMSSMALKSIHIGGRLKRFSSELQCVQELASLAGFRSDYDFYVVVRYLQFFTEERLEIMWSTGTQFEFFKMLFFDRDNANAIDKLFAEIQRLDSDYRNRKNQLTLRKESLRERSLPVTPEQQEVLDLEPKIAAAQDAFEEVQAEYNKARDEVQHTQDVARSKELEYDRAEDSLSELQDELERMDANYIGHALPGLDDKLRLLMHGYASGQGCFVCGTRGRKLASDIGKELSSGKCFACHSPVKRGAKTTPASDETLTELKALEAKAAAFRKAMDATRPEIDVAHKANVEAISALGKINLRREEVLRTLRALLALRPQSVAEISDIATEIEEEQRAIDAIDAKRKEKVDAYRKEVVVSREAMENVREALREKLTNYAQAFLQETIEVRFSASQDRITLATGAGQVGVPTFSILMSSSTNPVPSARVRRENVSESQAEFLDLAFRMALLDIISADGSAMLVMETPEASLDSWFVRKAGRLMRQFASETADPPRKLLVTSNLNGTEMIPALLGLVTDSGKRRKLSVTDRPRLVNLMEITAKAGVLKDSAAQAVFDHEMERITNG